MTIPDIAEALKRLEGKVDAIDERTRRIELRWAAIAGASGVVGGLGAFVLEWLVR